MDFGRAFESWILERNDEKLMDTLFTNQSLIQTDHVAAREDITLTSMGEKEMVMGVGRLDTLELDATDLLASFDADMFYQMEHIQKSQEVEEQAEKEKAIDKRKRKKGMLRKIGFGKEDAEGKSLSPSQSEHEDKNDQEENNEEEQNQENRK